MKPKFFLAAGVVLMFAFVLVLGTAAAEPAFPCDPAYVDKALTIIRVSPTGIDDTANIQCAFDLAVATGPGITIRLLPGTFHTAQIVVNGFHGIFRGGGADKTVIVNLPDLYVTPVDFFVDPPSAANPSPMLFSFNDGDIAISDLAIHINGGNVTTGWSIWGSPPIYELASAIQIGGTQADARVTRILIEGELMPETLFGYSVINGINFTGYVGLVPLPITGTYRLTNSTFKMLASGSPIGNLKDATVLISQNTYSDVFFMMDGGDFVNSSIQISSNKAHAFIGIDFYHTFINEDVGTHFVVRNNKFAGTYGVLFEQTFGADNTCLIKSNNFRQILDTGVLLVGPGTDQCVLKNNKE